jgi:membrane protein implicated in regulation of membrane protease activity
MIQSFFTDNGVWSWWILGMILIGIEVLAPGTFFLWFGLAAFFVGLISLIVGPDSAVWVWQAQIITFVVVALVFAIIGRTLMRRQGWDTSEHPDLNERGTQLIGRQAVLTQPISEGMGRARIGDTTWRVKGPDLPEGTKVKVVSAEAETLIVTAADA